MLLDDNLLKIQELDPSKRWAAVNWCKDCDKLDFQFHILEVYRTPERQKKLYAQGRTAPGPIVTYTLNSLHIKHLAIDIEPLNCMHSDIAPIAFRYGITHPLAFDPPHYEFNFVGDEPPPQLSLQERLLSAQKAVARFEGTPRGNLLQRLITRLKEAIHSKPF